MAVKFVRTCDRCGKVIEERNGYVVEGKEPAKSNAKYGVISAESHPIFTLKNFHLCPDCCEDFENFMQGRLVCDISDRECDSPALYKNIDEFGRGEITKEGLEQLKPSDEALALMREHNAKCDGKETELNKDGPIYKYISSFANKVSDSKITVERDDEKHNEKHDIKLKPGTHTYHIWTKEEDDFILHHSMGMTAAQLAYKFGVTVSAVKARKWMLATGKIRPKE